VKLGSPAWQALEADQAVQRRAIGDRIDQQIADYFGRVREAELGRRARPLHRWITPAILRRWLERQQVVGNPAAGRAIPEAQ